MIEVVEAAIRLNEQWRLSRGCGLCYLTDWGPEQSPHTHHILKREPGYKVSSFSDVTLDTLFCSTQVKKFRDASAMKVFVQAFINERNQKPAIGLQGIVSPDESEISDLSVHTPNSSYRSRF